MTTSLGPFFQKRKRLRIQNKVDFNQEMKSVVSGVVNCCIFKLYNFRELTK